MRQSKALLTLWRVSSWDLGQIASVFAGIVNLILQSFVVLSALSELALFACSSLIFAVTTILLLLGHKKASFTIYAVALLTSYSDVSWTGSELERHSSSVADLRLGPLSIAMWYLLLAVALIFFRRDLWRKGSDCMHHAVFREMRPLVVVTVLGVLQGAIRIVFSRNSFSDFAVDLFSTGFVFLFLYAVLGCLPQQRIDWLLRIALGLAVISVVINAVLGARIDYGGQSFVPIPDIINYLPIVMIAVYGTRRWLCAFFWFVYVGVVFGTGLITPTGKLIVVVLMSLAYLVILGRNGRFSRKRLSLVVLSIVALLCFADGIADFFDDVNYQVLAYKYRQVFAAGKIAMDNPVLFYGSSIGNLAAELNTVWTSSTPVDALLGRGFGAWYKDVTGYLAVADPMSYSDEINGSGHYRQFHLPVIDFLSWTGLVGIVFYFLMVSKLWKHIRGGRTSALLPLTILLFTLGFLKENQLMFALGLAYAMNQAKFPVEGSGNVCLHASTGSVPGSVTFTASNALPHDHSNGPAHLS